MIRILILVLISFSASAQYWTSEEFNAANTASNISFLTTEEKDIIRYINLARMFPSKFADLEVKNYLGPKEFGDYLEDSEYKESLYRQLQNLRPLPPLNFDREMFELAKCFALESGQSGYVGHNRRDCTQGNMMGECCDYGHNKGKDIALSLLIDHDVPSLGHRQICLSNRYRVVGIKISPHQRYRFCAVLDFR
ncbi:MAG: hypothetical protein ACK4V4_09715 [Sphingobacteriales bacterium]|jgi:hypothetical protein